MEFCYQKYYQDPFTKEWKEDKKSIPLCRERNTVYSDHFPIQCLLDIVPSNNTNNNETVTNPVVIIPI
jgi:hypothetical protein